MASQFDLSSLWEYRQVIEHGILLTTQLTAAGGLLGTFVGIFGAWSKTYGPPWLRRPVACYVEIIRNTPFLVQLFFIFFGLPSLGVRINEMQAAILAMTLNLGAYSTEIIRAGVNAIPRGQIEAAETLAMSRLQIFRYIILRPALAKIWPALSSQIVIVMLGSAVCSQISVEELSYAANFITGRNLRAFESYFAATVIYLVLAIVLRQVLKLVGRIFVSNRGAA